MPFTKVRGVNINYQVLGDTGAWVALSPGGRRDMSGIHTQAAALAALGSRVVICDRRAFRLRAIGRGILRPIHQSGGKRRYGGGLRNGALERAHRRAVGEPGHIDAYEAGTFYRGHVSLARLFSSR